MVESSRALGLHLSSSVTSRVNGASHTGWLKTAAMYSITVLEARSPKARCQQGRLLLRAVRENLFVPPS